MYENLLGKMIGLNELLGATFTDEENEMISHVVRKFHRMFDDNADLIQFYHVFGMDGFKKLYGDFQRISDCEARLSAKVDELVDLVSRQVDREIEARKAYCDLKYEWSVGLSVIADHLAFDRQHYVDSEACRMAIVAHLKNLEDYTRGVIERGVNI